MTRKETKTSSKKSASGKTKKGTKKPVLSFRQDAKQTLSLIKAGQASATKAIRESKALELSMTFMENGVLYREAPNGNKTILKRSGAKSNGHSIILKRGMILHAKD